VLERRDVCIAWRGVAWVLSGDVEERESRSVMNCRSCCTCTDPWGWGMGLERWGMVRLLAQYVHDREVSM